MIVCDVESDGDSACSGGDPARSGDDPCPGGDPARSGDDPCLGSGPARSGDDLARVEAAIRVLATLTVCRV